MYLEYREHVLEAAKPGRRATHKRQAQARKSETQWRQSAELKAWNPADQPDWLHEGVLDDKLQPRLRGATVPAIMRALGVSEPYALGIRSVRRVPHLRLVTSACLQRRLVGFQRGLGFCPFS